MAAAKQITQLAKQLFKLSVVDGEVSPTQVTGVLGWIEKHQQRDAVALLKSYQRLIAAELARSQAIVEHAGPISDTILGRIEGAMTQKYQRPVKASAKPNQDLLAGLRVRVGNDVYESSVAGQLATLSASV
jgi:F-type H+-transporting ATPase subunit delta